VNFSTFCALAREQLLAANFRLSHAQALELGSALLGYRTYAALRPDMEGIEVLTEADHAILQPEELARRMSELGFETTLAFAWLEAFALALEQVRDQAERTCQVHRSMAAFRDFVFQDVQDRAVVDDDVLNAYAGTNAAADEFYVDDYEHEPLLQSNEEWILTVLGSHTDELDEDRPYSGHAGDFQAKYRFRKDGRCGLIELELEFDLDFSRDFT
jgi:hypothetical protein